MAKLVTTGAMLQCTFGTTPCSLMVTDPTRPKCGNLPMATIQDSIPSTNIPTIGMCQSITNPQVSSATAAAMGTLTPQPCIPAIASAWSPGSAQIKVKGVPALTNTCKCMCMWAGNISITNPGNTAIADVK